MPKLYDYPDKVVLHLQIKPKSQHHNAVLEALYDTIAPTHKEEGCLSYRVFHQDKAICVLGEWKNQMALDMHLLFQYHLQLFEQTLPPLCKKIKQSQYRELEPPITALSLS